MTVLRTKVFIQTNQFKSSNKSHTWEPISQLKADGQMDFWKCIMSNV